MTQQPPLQPPQPPEDPQQRSADPTEHTTPLWYSQTQPQPQAHPAGSPQTTAEPRPAGLLQPDVERAQRAKPPRLVELVAVAALAAVLSSAGTYAAIRSDLAASPTSQTTQSRTNAATAPAPVVQANPAAPNWAVTAAVVQPSVVAISLTSGQGSGQGSGVIFDTEGQILTNNHVVAAGGRGSQISVILNDKRTYDATVVGTDPSTDLAVIRLTNAPNDLKAIALGDSDALRVGDPVMAVGNPLGLAGTVTTGIVSALNRPVTTSQSGDSEQQQPAGEPVVTNAVQTSAAINPGNSGGALVNGGGQLVGINSSIASLGSGGGQAGNIGIGFAIPVNEAAQVANQLITVGKATHAFLGVRSRDDVVVDGSARRAAAVLTDVTPESPAAQAGLRPGDAITAVDGEPVDGFLSLVAQVRERTAGEKVTIRFVRDGQSREVTVALADRPSTNP